MRKWLSRRSFVYCYEGIVAAQSTTEVAGCCISENRTSKHIKNPKGLKGMLHTSLAVRAVVYHCVKYQRNPESVIHLCLGRGCHKLGWEATGTKKQIFFRPCRWLGMADGAFVTDAAAMLLVYIRAPSEVLSRPQNEVIRTFIEKAVWEGMEPWFLGHNYTASGRKETSSL